jgi:hypothetical protein
VGYEISPCYFNFYNQSDGEITVDYTAEFVSDVATGAGAFISGNGSKFSLFIEFSGVSQGVEYTQVAVYTGTVSSSGIQSFQMGIILTDKVGDESNSVLMPVGGHRMFQEDDDLAETVSTYPESEAKSLEGSNEAASAVGAAQ